MGAEGQGASHNAASVVIAVARSNKLPCVWPGRLVSSTRRLICGRLTWKFASRVNSQAVFGSWQVLCSGQREQYALRRGGMRNPISYEEPCLVTYLQSQKLHVRMRACLVSRLCLALCNPWLFATPWALWSPPGSSVHGVFQASIRALVAIFSSRRSSQPRDWTCISCISCFSKWILYHHTTWKAPKAAF